jgi:hypothetical protein
MHQPEVAEISPLHRLPDTHTGRSDIDCDLIDVAENDLDAHGT